jgi:peptide/nickel transport system substrate-binding protein
MNAIHRSYAKNFFDLPTYYAVFWNQSANPALTDPAVRSALYLAVNREELTRNVWGEGATPDYGPIPPSFKNLPQFTPTSTDLDAINQSLDKAGWSLAGDVRQKTISKTLIPLSFKLTVPNLPFLMDTAEKLQEYWSKIGAQVEIVSVDPSNALDDTVKNRDYEGLLLGNALNSGADLFSFWHSTQRFAPGLNLSLYQNHAVDALIESVRGNFDEEGRAGQFEKLSQTILADNPAVFLYSPKYIYLTSKSLEGLNLQMLTDPADRFLGVENWYVKTTRVLK